MQTENTKLHVSKSVYKRLENENVRLRNDIKTILYGEYEQSVIKKLEYLELFITNEQIKTSMIENKHLVKLEVCREYGVVLDDLKNKSREPMYSIPRQVYYYLMNKIFYLYPSELARDLGFTHSSVDKALENVRDLCYSNAHFRTRIEYLEQRCKEIKEFTTNRYKK